MRVILTAILFFGFYVFGSGQDCTVTSDTYSYGKKFLHSELILRSDATFNLRNRSCTHSLLMMGFWERQDDSIVLNYTKKIAVSVSSRSFKAGEDDSLVKFFVRDANGNVLKDYYLTFYRKGHTDEGFITDSNGMVSVKRRLYEKYHTETDEQNLMEDEDWDNWDKMKRPLSSKAKEIYIILYPLATPLQDRDNNTVQRRSFYIQQKDILVAGIAEYKKRQPR